MKNRIKKFYRDHEDGCIRVAAGFAVLGSLFALHQARGYRIDRVGLFQNDEGDRVIIVKTQNGKIQSFHKNNPNC